MLLIAGLGRLIPKVHVQQTLGLGFIKVFGQRNLGSQNATGLGKHALLTSRQTMLVNITLRKVTHHFRNFIDIAGGDLLDIQLVATRPVHLLLNDRSAQNLEHLGHFVGVDDISHTNLLALSTGTLMTRPSDESTDSCRYSRVIPLTVRSVMASTFAAP